MKKSLKEREKDLKDALELIEDALLKIQDGNKIHLKNLAVHLRALICTGGRLNPLLLNLANEKNIFLQCYAFPFDEFRKLMKNPVFLMGPRCALSYKPGIGFKRFEFKEWLELNYLIIAKDEYNPNKLIRTFAEKEVGHYDKGLPENFIKVKKVVYHKSGIQFNEIEKLFCQIGDVVIYFGKLILSPKKN